MDWCDLYDVLHFSSRGLLPRNLGCISVSMYWASEQDGNDPFISILLPCIHSLIEYSLSID